MTYAGIDAGSRAVKVVLIDDAAGDVVAAGIADQGTRQNAVALSLLDRVLAGAGLRRDDLDAVIATGYGRDAIDSATETVTEITCHARGVAHTSPGCMTVIDIGGQDSKLIRLRDGGRVRDFAMNDRCAAGTGRFLEVVADRLGLGLDALGAVAAAADMPSSISSMCVVFAETEITGLLAAGESEANIVAGVQAAIATRIASMAGRGVHEPVVFTGGVAEIPGMPGALSAALQCPVTVAENPRHTGALGAALIAAGGAE